MTAISKKRFKTLFEMAGEHLVDKKGDFCVLYSEETQEHAMFYKSISKKKKFKIKGVLTNAFDNALPPRTKGYVPFNQIKVAYAKYFGMNDRFNTYLYDRYFKYTRVGYEANYDSFFISVIEMNVFCLHHESQQISENYAKYEAFTADLARSLLDFLVRFKV
jgi:hypothetical protein